MSRSIALATTAAVSLYVLFRYLRRAPTVSSVALTAASSLDLSSSLSPISTSSTGVTTITSINLYFYNVYSSFREHFNDDPELQSLLGSMGFLDASRVLSRFVIYHDNRWARGGIPLQCAHGLGPTCPCFETSGLAREFARRAPLAYLAYEDDTARLRETLLSAFAQHLVFHEPISGTFRPAHFMSFAHNTNTLIVAIRGTSSFDDLWTNLFIKPELLSAHNECVHGGLLQAARWLLDRVGPVLKVFLKAGFSIELIGHSMGAGVASIVAVILHDEWALDDKVKCYCFAPPPSAGMELALSAKSYVFSVVNNSDCIPRFGVAQLKNLAAMLSKVNDSLSRQGKDWGLVEAELDSKGWGELMARWTTYQEKVFNTYIPGQVLFIQEQPNVPEGQPRFLRVLVDGTFSWLRVPDVSSRMLGDHSMEKYMQALSVLPTHSTTTMPTTITPPVIRSGIENWLGMDKERLNAFQQIYKF